MIEVFRNKSKNKLTVAQRLLVKVGLREDYCWDDFMVFFYAYPTMAKKFIACILFLITAFMLTVSTVAYAAVSVDYKKVGNYLAEMNEVRTFLPVKEVKVSPPAPVKRDAIAELLDKQNAFIDIKIKENEESRELVTSLNSTLVKTIRVAERLVERNQTLEEQIASLEIERINLIAKVMALERRQVEDKETIQKLKHAEQKLVGAIFN